MTKFAKTFRASQTYLKTFHKVKKVPTIMVLKHMMGLSTVPGVPLLVKYSLV